MFLRLTADTFQHSTKSILISFSWSACPSLGFSQILFFNPVLGLGDKGEIQGDETNSGPYSAGLNWKVTLFFLK